jgi:hypothetical protein
MVSPSSMDPPRGRRTYRPAAGEREGLGARVAHAVGSLSRLAVEESVGVVVQSDGDRREVGVDGAAREQREHQLGDLQPEGSR